MKLLRKTLFLCLILSSILSTYADSYITLWKEIESAKENDLPQTALRSIDKIIKQAHKKGDTGHLVKALVTKHYLQEYISPDSADILISFIEKQVELEKSKVGKSLLHITLGKLYKQQEHFSPHSATTSKSIFHYRKAIDNPAALAFAKASDYLPAIILGKDGDIFQNDVLNLVNRNIVDAVKWENPQIAKEIIHKSLETYRQLGNKDAELLLLLDSVDIQPAENIKQRLEYFEKLKKRFSNRPICAEVALRQADLLADSIAYDTLLSAIKQYSQYSLINQLKNRVQELCSPFVSLHVNKRNFYPGQTDSFNISIRNIKQAKICLYRTDFTQTSNGLSRRNNDEIKLSPKDCIQTITINYSSKSPATLGELKIPFLISQPGIYYVRIESDKCKSTPEIIYCTSTFVTARPLSNGEMRFLVADSWNGHPINHAKISIWDTESNLLIDSLHTDKFGYATIPLTENKRYVAFAEVEKDNYCPGLTVHNNNSDFNYRGQQTRLALFCDRSIYRPGQKIQIGGFLYGQKGDDIKVIPQENVTLTLFDTNHKKIDAISCQTDEFGSIQASFCLPSTCLCGTFSVESPRGSVRFNVEEYKRPTFKLDLEQSIPTTFNFGERIEIKGIVSTYTNIPIKNSRITIEVEKKIPFWSGYRRGHEIIQCDTMFTDEEGHFIVPITIDSIEKDLSIPKFCCFLIRLTALNSEGETITKEHLVYPNNTRTQISCTLPNKICKEKSQFFTIRIHSVNSSTDSIVNWKLSKDGIVVEQGLWSSLNPISTTVFNKLPSGIYSLTLSPKGVTDSQSICKLTFSLFSMRDNRSVTFEKLEAFCVDESFSENGVATIRLASSYKDAWIHYQLNGSTEEFENKIIHISDSIVYIPIKYKAEYGDGITADFAIIKEGEIKSSSVNIFKPQPDKALTLRWKAFRDYSMPGKQELWQLQVLRHGKSIPASVMATLFDASLLTFKPHNWDFSLYFPRYVSSRNWNHLWASPLYLHATQKIKPLNSREWQFDYFDNETFSPFGKVSFQRNGVYGISKSTKPLFAKAKLSHSESTFVESSVNEQDNSIETQAISLNENEDLSSIRTDFRETAFFVPMGKTDANGIFKIEFTLPQSLTSWQFRALAHSQDMCYGRLDTTIVVSKPFALQAILPQFLRDSDTSMVAVALHNYTFEQQTGVIRMELIEPESNKIIFSATQSFILQEKHDSTFNFYIQQKGEVPILICRFSADTPNFSDGEQYYLPIIKSEQRITHALPIQINKNSTHIDLSPLNSLLQQGVKGKSISFQYISNPNWLAIESLPVIFEKSGNDALSLTNNFYALSLAHYISKSHPRLKEIFKLWKDSLDSKKEYISLLRNHSLQQIKLNETPWIKDADLSLERLDQMSELFDTLTFSLTIHSYIDKLLALQNADGGWEWWKNMPSSPWVTLEVAVSLARVKKLTGTLPIKLDNALNKSLDYLESYFSKTSIGKHNNKQELIANSSLIAKCLYAQALSGKPLSKFGKQWLKQLYTNNRNATILTKALCARTLALYNQTKQALTFVQSLKEQSVFTNDKGRWFEGKNAEKFSESDKLITQVAVLEAIECVSMEDTITKKQLLQYLVTSKYSQQWNQPTHFSDATFYLLQKFGNIGNESPTPDVSFEYSDGKKVPINFQKNASILGCVHADISLNDTSNLPVALYLENCHPNAFASIHASSILPMENVKSNGKELQIKPSFYIQSSDGQWKLLNFGHKAKIGDLIKVQFEITADRPFDCISVYSPRPACVIAEKQISGFDYTNNCYREVKTTSSQYFFYNISKGKTVFEDTWRVERKGTFSTGATIIQCAIAPEFIGTSNSFQFIIN